MTCSACAIAKINPRTARFDAGCAECDARGLAGGPWYLAARESPEGMERYRAALRATFGAGWKDGHALVRAWAEKLAARKVGRP